MDQDTSINLPYEQPTTPTPSNPAIAEALFSVTDVAWFLSVSYTEAERLMGEICPSSSSPSEQPLYVRHADLLAWLTRHRPQQADQEQDQVLPVLGD